MSIVHIRTYLAMTRIISLPFPTGSENQRRGDTEELNTGHNRALENRGKINIWSANTWTHKPHQYWKWPTAHQSGKHVNHWCKHQGSISRRHWAAPPSLGSAMVSMTGNDSSLFRPWKHNRPHHTIPGVAPSPSPGPSTALFSLLQQCNFRVL